MLSWLAGTLEASWRLVRTPAFWGVAVALVVVALALAALVIFAIERHDSFLRLRPLICDRDISDRKFFLVAVAAPPGLIFVLTTVGEFWQQLDNWRNGRPARWRHFWLFLALASGLGALVLFGLTC